MTVDVTIHSVTRYTSQLRRTEGGARWRKYLFYDKNDVELLELTCFMDEHEGVEDLFLERLPPIGFDEVSAEKYRDLSEETGEAKEEGGP